MTEDVETPKCPKCKGVDLVPRLTIFTDAPIILDCGSCGEGLWPEDFEEQAARLREGEK